MSRNDARVNEETLAGQVRDSSGISRSVDMMGKMTVKPETKYSYRRVRRSDSITESGLFTLRTWDIESAKTNPTSAPRLLNFSGLSLPNLSILAFTDSPQLALGSVGGISDTVRELLSIVDDVVLSKGFMRTDLCVLKVD
jgi:hypothetical protein